MDIPSEMMYGVRDLRDGVGLETPVYNDYSGYYKADGPQVAGPESEGVNATVQVPWNDLMVVGLVGVAAIAVFMLMPKKR